MSIIAYAQLTSARERSTPGKSFVEEPPGIRSYIDALAGLVPAEILVLHAAIISVTTRTENDVIKIVEKETLRWAFFGLIGLSVVIYFAARKLAGKWDRLDMIRVLIPPAAFVGWTMIQKATAFDALSLGLGDAQRTVSALFVAVLLALLATALAYKADQSASPS